MSRLRITIAMCVGILVFGAVAMLALGSLREDPAEAAPAERALRVEAVRALPEDIQVTIREFGEVRAIDVVTVSTEVSGTIVEVHPNLDMGRVVPKGDTLFRIDPRTYESNVDQAEAQIATLKSTINRLKVQQKTDKDRLQVVRRTADLAQAEYERRQTLLERDEVGTMSGLEAQEQALNTALEALKRIEQAVETYPLQISEAEGQLAAAEAQLDMARLNLERTRVVAPFNARVKDRRVIVGQYVSPGQPVLTLANDGVLEISVSIDSNDARQWLAFDDEGPVESVAWFNNLKQVDCTIRWTADKENHAWAGTLNRVEEFDPETRTITVAVRVTGEQAISKNGGIPLVDGMFCMVEIPGRMLENVVGLPQSAVTFENTVYCAVDNRLKTVPVKVAWQGAEQEYVSEGIQAGDIVVTTRLVNPLENSLLELNVTGDSAEDAS